MILIYDLAQWNKLLNNNDTFGASNLPNVTALIFKKILQIKIL